MSKDMIDPTPGRRGARSGSLTDALLALPIGGEHAGVRFLDPGEDDVSEDGLSDARTKLTNTFSKTISRIKADVPALDFQTESAVVVTSRNRIYIVVIATRIS